MMRDYHCRPERGRKGIDRLHHPHAGLRRVDVCGHHAGQHVDENQVGRELGVRYVLEGSVRKSGGRVRISAQLVDATTGAHLWADRFDGSLEDVFELQDRVASCVAGVIEPTLQAVETARSADRPTNDLAAYDLYLRAYEMYFVSAQEIPEALGLLERAIERDPRYGPALAWAAVCCLRLEADGSSTDPALEAVRVSTSPGEPCR